MHEEQRPNSTAAVAVQQNFDKQQIRWSFTDLFHSFMVVFRALCGEWVESMYDCIVVSGDKSSIVYFHALAFIGSFLVSYYFVIVFFSFHFWLLFLLLRLFNTWCECVCCDILLSVWCSLLFLLLLWLIWIMFIYSHPHIYGDAS